jgi:hypothetical protein
VAQKAFLWYLPDLDYVFQIDFRNKLEDIFIFLELVYEVMKFIDRGFTKRLARSPSCMSKTASPAPMSGFYLPLPFCKRL